MKITNVGVTYSELRTFGTKIAKKEVKKFFGDKKGNPLDIPF